MRKAWLIASLSLAIGLVSVSGWSAVPVDFGANSTCVLTIGNGIQAPCMNDHVGPTNVLGAVKPDNTLMVIAHGGGGGGAGAGGCGGDAGSGGDGAGGSGGNGGEGCGSAGDRGGPGSSGANHGGPSGQEHM